MMHHIMLSYCIQPENGNYTEELMIKLATLLKIVWVMEFDKATFKNQFFNIKIEAHLL